MNILSDDECHDDHEENFLQASKNVNGYSINESKDINFIRLLNECLESENNKVYICNCCHSVHKRYELIKCCNCYCNLCETCIKGNCIKEDCYDQIKNMFDINDFIELCEEGSQNFNENILLNEIFDCKFCGKYQIAKNYEILHI